MLRKLSALAAEREWKSLSEFLLELDTALAGLSGESRRIKRRAERAQEYRRVQPPTNIELRFRAGEGT